MSPFIKRAIPVVFAVVGLAGLHLILKDFGYARIRQDIVGLGPDIFPILLCFLFPHTLLALSWWVLLNGTKASFPYTFFVNLVANAWNNIGPVAKSLGEPTRVILLAGRAPIRQAVRSMMLFNITQALGTSLAFGSGAALAPILFDLPDSAFYITIASALVAFSINILTLYWMLSRPSGRKARSKGRTLRGLFHWVRWISHQLRKFARNNPRRCALSVGLAAMARISEGIVFYAIFSALGAPITLLQAVAIDIGRGIADNAFFFVPYQLGTRELALAFVTESILRSGKETAVAASLVFRLGEIFWILFGYLVGVWMLKSRPLAK